MPSGCLKLSLLYLKHTVRSFQVGTGMKGKLMLWAHLPQNCESCLPLIQAFHFLCALPPNLHHGSCRLTFHLSVSQHCFKIQTFKKVRNSWVRGWVVPNRTGYTGSSDNSSAGFHQSAALADDPAFAHVHKENVRRKQSLRSSAILETRFMQKSVSDSDIKGSRRVVRLDVHRKKKQADTSPWSVLGDDVWSLISQNWKLLCFTSDLPEQRCCDWQCECLSWKIHDKLKN